MRFASAVAVLAVAALTGVALPAAASTRSVALNETASRTLGPVLAAPAWLNGRVTSADTAGKVVIVDVFTFDCINCKHVVPNLRRLRAAHAADDLLIIGVHAPETSYESRRENVVRELGRQGIAWPVAVDNDFAIWRALRNEYWPTQYVFDRHGTLRKVVVGEGLDDELNATVGILLAEH